MIGIARANETIDVFDGVRWITVPRIGIPDGVEWSASTVPGQPAFLITFEHDGKQATTLWWGPNALPDGNTYYIIDAPKRVLQFLKSRLGDANVAPLIRALRARPALRAWCKAQGFGPIRNSAGRPVGVLPPLTICGQNPRDLDLDEGEDIDNIPELLDLEP